MEEGGTGKTHIATALSVQAVERHRKRVWLFFAVGLVNAFEQEKAAGKAGQLAARLFHTDLLILDELGYCPFSASGRALPFYLLSRLYEQITIIITTGLSFGEWCMAPYNHGESRRSWRRDGMERGHTQR